MISRQTAEPIKPAPPVTIIFISTLTFPATPVHCANYYLRPVYQF
jgi:hypothetical protein